MGDERESERKPLLQNASGSADSRYSTVGTEPQDDNVVSALAQNEMPPPYHTVIKGSAPMVKCRVCQATIDLAEQHVVKCSHCNEATPIRDAPPGKKYVRCPCNCLLICKSSSSVIACPRPDCKRIINLAPSPATYQAPTLPGMCSVACAYCHSIFPFYTLSNAVALCPYCRKMSSVGPDFARNRAIIFIVLGLVFLAIGIGLTVGTSEYALEHAGLFVPYICAFIAALFFFGRSLHFYAMKVSIIQRDPIIFSDQ